jgi:hypothetical protein
MTDELQKRGGAAVATRRARLRGYVILGGAIAGGALLGFAITAAVPSAILATVSAAVGGVFVSSKRRIAAQLDRGEFEPYLENLERKSAKAAPGSLREGFVHAQRAYLAMRRNRLEEARALFEEYASREVIDVWKDYCAVSAAACAALLGESVDIELPAVVAQGTAIPHCIILGRRGEIEAALAMREARVPFTKAVLGRRRFFHERRMLALLQAALRGDVSRKQRVTMVAGYPGEFDYVAEHWPEVRAVVDELALYQAEPPKASVQK